MAFSSLDMARFDVYTNPDSDSRALIPFFLDVQNDHIAGLQTRVVVPLWNAEALSSRLADLNPELEVAGQRVVMDTPTLAAVPIALLKHKVGSLSSMQMSIQNALETLFGGF